MVSTFRDMFATSFGVIWHNFALSLISSLLSLFVAGLRPILLAEILDEERLSVTPPKQLEQCGSCTGVVASSSAEVLVPRATVSAIVAVVTLPHFLFDALQCHV